MSSSLGLKCGCLDQLGLSCILEVLCEASFIPVLIWLSCLVKISFVSEVSHCQTEALTFPLPPCVHPHLLTLTLEIYLFIWSKQGDFGSTPRRTAPNPAHRPLQGCRLHPQQQPSSCSTQKGSCPKSLPQFVSVILAVNARGRVQSFAV